LNAREQPILPDVASANGNGSANGVTAMEPPSLPNFADEQFLLADILDPNAFDFSWDALWDTPSGMTNFSI
jgi:hypothetical protein